LERLKHSLQLLASQPDIPLGLLPDFVCRADELALQFDPWYVVVLRNFRSEMTVDQLSALDSLDHSLSELTKEGPHHWTDEAVRSSDRWRSVRALAAAALHCFNWPNETPPSHADEYVGK